MFNFKDESSFRCFGCLHHCSDPLIPLQHSRRLDKTCLTCQRSQKRESSTRLLLQLCLKPSRKSEAQRSKQGLLLFRDYSIPFSNTSIEVETLFISQNGRPCKTRKALVEPPTPHTADAPQKATELKRSPRSQDFWPGEEGSCFVLLLLLLLLAAYTSSPPSCFPILFLLPIVFLYFFFSLLLSYTSSSPACFPILLLLLLAFLYFFFAVFLLSYSYFHPSCFPILLFLLLLALLYFFFSVFLLSNTSSSPSCFPILSHYDSIPLLFVLLYASASYCPSSSSPASF